MQVSCLKWPCVGRHLLWLHFGETERSGFVKGGAWSRRCAGCSRCCGLGREHSSAGTVSTSTLADTWTEPPASGRRDSDRKNSQKSHWNKETTRLSMWLVVFRDNVFPGKGFLSARLINTYPPHNNMLITDFRWDLESTKKFFPQN